MGLTQFWWELSLVVIVLEAVLISIKWTLHKYSPYFWKFYDFLISDCNVHFCLKTQNVFNRNTGWERTLDLNYKHLRQSTYIAYAYHQCRTPVSNFMTLSWYLMPKNDYSNWRVWNLIIRQKSSLFQLKGQKYHPLW